MPECKHNWLEVWEHGSPTPLVGAHVPFGQERKLYCPLCKSFLRLQ